MKQILLIVLIFELVVIKVNAQDIDTNEKYRFSYDSLVSLIKHDTLFFKDLQKSIEISDSLLSRFEFAITKPFDSLGHIITSSHMEYSNDGSEKKVIENGDPVYISQTLLEFNSYVDNERKYQSEINLFYNNLQRENIDITNNDIVGTYIKIESSGFTIENGDTIPDTDSTIIVIKHDSTFTYTWSPIFGSASNKHIQTNGHWTFMDRKLILNSEYQQDEWRFFEYYKPEYGDSITKVYVQTYDSLVGYFQFQKIGVMFDTLSKSSLTFADKEYPEKRCVTTFNFPNADKIIFYGSFGRMPIIEPKNKKSNCFILQYNLSTHWDYQYMKDLKWDFKGGEISAMQGWGERMILTKIKE